MDKNTYTLVVDAGGEYYKKFMLRDMHDYIRPIALVTNTKVSWERRYIDAEIPVASYSNDAVLKAVEAFPRKKSINSVLTYSEKKVPVTAFLAHKLGLKGLSGEASLRARSKNLMRSAFERHCVPSAKFLLIRSIEEAEGFVLKTGYPVVLKPVMGSASKAVVKVESHLDLPRYFDHVRQLSIKEYGSEELLIEEYLDGREVSVESVVCDGKATVIAVTDKFKSAEPFFEEIGHIVPSNLPESIVQSIKDVAISGMKALGINNGVTHSEVKITSYGPKIVEIAARPAGDFIPKLVELSTGVNLNRALVDVSLGRQPDIKHTANKVSAVCFIVPEREGILLGHSGTELFQQFGWVKEFEFVGVAGERVMLPPNKYYTRFGHYILEANDRSQMDERIRLIGETFKLEIFEGL